MSRARFRRKVLSFESLEVRDLFAAGVLDKSFDADGMVITNIGPGVTNGVNAASVQLDVGKVVVAATVPGANGDTGDFAIIRYLKNGQLDTSFGSSGKASTSIAPSSFDYAADFAIAPDGKYVVVGKSVTLTTDFAVVRFLPNGTLDASFSSDGKSTYQLGASADFEEASAVVIQGDGKIIIGGDFAVNGSQDKYFGLTRINVDGSVDTSFGSGGKVLTNFGTSSDNLSDLKLQTVGGQTYVVATGRSYNGSNYDMVLARYTLSGVLDTTFGQAGIVRTNVQGNDNLKTLLVQPDGKLIGVGAADGLAGQRLEMALVRYNTNGSLDASFGAGGISVLSRPDDQLLSGAVLQPDGRIIVAGTWIYNGTSSYRQTMAARFDASGNLDSSYGVSGFALWDVNPANNSANDENLGGGAALQPDGRLILAGSVQPVGASTRTQLCVSRLTADDAPPAEIASSYQRTWTANDLDLALGILMSGNNVKRG